MEKSVAKSTTYVRRLGRHHFAHLRAVAQGVDPQASAKRYLGVEHGHEANTAHAQTREAVRALARRLGDNAWRLIGWHIQTGDDVQRPTLEDFIGDHDLEGWGESEIIAMYQDSYPADRKTARRFVLQQRQLTLLYNIEASAAETPRPQDLISDWFEPLISARIIAAGMIHLGALNAKISVGGRWYAALPGVGKVKADRILAHLATLLPLELQPAKKFFPLENIKGLETGAPRRWLAHDSENRSLLGGPPHESPSAVRLMNGLLEADTDSQAVEAWIAARAGSTLTSTAYRREATRLLLWLQHEGDSRTFAQMSIGCCLAYMAFLQNIPARWISRERAAPGMPGWAPFRGPLSPKSYRQAIVIISSLFAWLASTQYLKANPWVALNKKTGDDASESMLDTKALSEIAMREIHAYIDVQKPSPARARIRFILRFVEAVGLRSAELLRATLGDLSLQPEGWVMNIHGKGAKYRVAVVPGQAFAALEEYLDVRGVGGIGIAPPHAPLLASALDPMEGVGYQALYEHVGGWMAKAIAASALPAHERAKLVGASTHWLRHTFGTRAVAREVPLDVIQAQMGHASIQTTMSIYGRAPIKRRVDALGKAFG